jgi:hypothetical protein
MMLNGCKPETDADRLTELLRGASLKLHSDSRLLTVDFTYRPKANDPYVVVLLPAEQLRKETVAALDLPLKAREWLGSEVKARSLPGPMLGLLESTRAEWHQLEHIASVPQVLYVWKKPGEDITMELKMRNSRAEISSLR